MRISDWSSDVCSSDLQLSFVAAVFVVQDDFNGGGRLNQPSERMPRGLQRWEEIAHDFPRAAHFNDVIALVERETGRSEARRVWTGWVRQCSARWSTFQ